MPSELRRSREIERRIGALLNAAGLSDEIDKVEVLSGSGNNRTYRVTTKMGICVAKQYFSHADDPRDRLTSEFTFLTYAHRAAPGWAPAPLAADPETGIAIYEYVPGGLLRPGEVTAAHVDAAARFFVALNAEEHRTTAQLPVASEACFSIEEHLALIEARLEKLQLLDKQQPYDREAHDLVTAIMARWKGIKAGIRKGASAAGLEVTLPIDNYQRCVSPSDFGFHNALLQPDGKMRFLDFEYAGWDDPAKMAVDFFSQLAVPVPSTFFENFIAACFGSFPEGEALKARARLIRPAYYVKWCCIALNVFLPLSLARRKFADPALDEQALKRQQVSKATQIFQSNLACDHGLH